MPVWLFLAVAGGLFTGLLLTMIIGFHLVERDAAKHCVHKSQQQEVYTEVSETGHLCCLCGNVRNRKGQALKSTGRGEALKSNGILQPLMDVACFKLPSNALQVRYLGNRTSQKPGIVGSLPGSWFNAGGFFKRTRKEVRATAKKGDAHSPALSAASTASTESVSAGSTASTYMNGSGSGATTTITTTITTTTSPSSSSAPQSCGVSTSGSEESDTKRLPQRRLVLEILMSPSGDEQGGALPRATGVRLKLETNGNLDSLANLAAAASAGVGDSNTQGPADIATGTGYTTDLASTACGPIPSIETGPSMSHGHSGSASRGPKSSCHLTRQGINVRGDCTLVTTPLAGDAGLNGADTKAKATAGLSDELESFNAPAVGGSIGSGSAVSHSKSTGISAQPAFSFSTNATKIKLNSHFTSNIKSKPKGGYPTLQCSSPLSAFSNATACVNFAGQSLGTSKAPTSHQVLNNSTSDGLGSLRISLLDAGTKGKSLKECNKGVTADIASALAALNVDSIGGKGVGMGSGIVSGVIMTEAGKGGNSEVPCSKSSFDLLLDEELIGEGSGSEHGVDEGEEHHTLGSKKGQGRDEDDADGKKKEKRKKKHRVRRHKAKATASGAKGNNATDRKEHDKLVTDHGEMQTAVASSEVEVGCLCGTAKTECHSNSCPYPFTCSGSMVQRKIKEQYDELVRSNAAKTLTLAQVGRFTTCLVEAKSALQQKSDTIQRRFTIAKSLLAKADKSSFDRLCGQIYGLENEQKKLEEDTVVYNRLQEQLKLSPAYLKVCDRRNLAAEKHNVVDEVLGCMMLEYGRAHFELQPNTGQLIEKVETDDEEISFEELLAQEKKDSFWQKHGPARSSVQVS